MVASTGTRRAVRKPIADIAKQYHLFLTNWSQAKACGTARDSARDQIKGWMAGHVGKGVEVDENGHQRVDFDVPLEVDGKKYVGLENRRTVATGFDVEAAMELVDSLPAADRKRAVKTVVTEEIDQGMLFVLNQEGKISDDELDSCITERVTYSLNVLRD